MNQENSTQESKEIETIEEIVLVEEEQDESEEDRNRYYEFFRH